MKIKPTIDNGLAICSHDCPSCYEFNSCTGKNGDWEDFSLCTITDITTCDRREDPRSVCVPWYIQNAEQVYGKIIDWAGIAGKIFARDVDHVEKVHTEKMMNDKAVSELKLVIIERHIENEKAPLPMEGHHALYVPYKEIRTVLDGGEKE